MLQLRVIRAFKSTLENLEDSRSIHSLRSYQKSGQSPALANFFSQHKAALLRQSQQSSTESGNISIPIPSSHQSPPLNLNDFTARYMDDDGPSSIDEKSNGNGQSKETRI
jgi:hypothetical protein